MEEIKTTDEETPQILYNIRVYKDFQFPSFCIDKNNHLSDLYTKSLQELAENFQTEGYFNLEIKQKLPFSIKTLEGLQNPGPINGPIDVNFLVNELALKETESKYGVFDYKKNPSIYQNVEKGSPYTPNILPEVEKYFVDRYSYFLSIIGPKLIRQ